MESYNERKNKLFELARKENNFDVIVKNIDNYLNSPDYDRYTIGISSRAIKRKKIGI